MCGIANGTITRRVREETKLKFYTAAAVPTQLNGSDTAVKGNGNFNDIQEAEMKSLSTVKGGTRLRKTENDDVQRN
jgi:hypothetical protein